MSLMQFLAVSPTFSQARNKADDYKVRSRLPQFTPGKAGVAPLVAQREAVVKLVQPSLFDKPVVKAAVVAKAASPFSSPVPVTEPTPRPAPAQPAQPIPAAISPVQQPSVALERKGRSWREAIRGLFFGRGKQPVKTKTVQTELALEQVKVVRNDLSDADLEIISKKGRKQSQRELAGLAWTRLTARIFHPQEAVEKTELQASPGASQENVVASAAAELPAEKAEAVVTSI